MWRDGAEADAQGDPEVCQLFAVLHGYSEMDEANGVFPDRHGSRINSPISAPRSGVIEPRSVSYQPRITARLPR